MKISRTKIRMMLIAFVTLAIVSCTPEDGDTGPVGPVGSLGPAGATGPAGPAGQNGQDGIDGNPDVKAYTFTVDTSMWTTGGGGSNAVLTVPQITQDVYDGGTIQLFHRFATSTTGDWNNMPYSTYFTSGATVVPYHITFSYNVGTVGLRVYSDLGAIITFNQSMEFKVVVIPSSSLVKNMDYKNHEMLQALYGI